MNNQTDFAASRLRVLRALGAGTKSVLVAAMLLLACAGVTVAQETTSGMRVTAYGADGSPVSGATVTVTDTRTGRTASGQTNASGLATFRGLNIGGPYTVKVASGAHADQTVTDANLQLGDTLDLVVQLGAATMEEVVVTASQLQAQQVALGPSQVFGLETLQDLPHANRDIRDVVQVDPRVYIDVGFVGAVQCSGANPRFNSLTVDGVRLNDLFGLNSNGYPTERQPFSYDSIQEVAVELAPFDVFYGGFTACNVNAVTKSGTNEFHGSAFYDYTSDGIQGDKLEGDRIDTGDFSEDRYGFTIGGPIVKDKLFFFAAYEKLEGANQFDRVPAGSATSGRVIQGVSQAQLDEIYSIAQSVYGYTPGPIERSLPVEDEKITVKLDWDINEQHRAAFTYNYNDGFNWSESDSDDTEFEDSLHYYERGAELNSYTGALFSNWSNNFATEVRVSRLELDNRQLSRANGQIGEVQVETWNDPDGDGIFSSALVYLGHDDSRQSNKLNYDATNIKLAGEYGIGDNLVTFGLERDDLDIFNLFIQHTIAEYRFDEECNPGNPNGCIEAFREGRPDDIYYGNFVPGDPLGGAAVWGYKINTAYIQNEWVGQNGDLTLVFGLRYDWYETNDEPAANPFFFDRQGFANTANSDGLDLLQPRIGFTWDYSQNLTFRGGVGLYSGGNPNVWLSNNYSNDGFRIAQVREFQMEFAGPDAPASCGGGTGVDFSLFDIPLSGEGVPLRNVPQCLFDLIAEQQPNSGVNALDPNFDLPSQWKFALGASWYLPGDYLLNADLLYTESQDSAIVINGTLEQTGTAPDGRPIYRDSRAFNSDYILTNVQGSDARSAQFAVNLSKEYDNGFNWNLGYAYTDAEDVSPMTSSVAFSNYANLAVDDPNNPSRATSNYEIPHRFTLRLGYKANWWGDNQTKFTLFGSVNEGRPFSYTFADDDGGLFGDFIDGRHLLYVPTGPNDPRVQFAPGFDTNAFFAFVNESGLDSYAGEIAPRNAFNSDWWTTFDIRIEQEFPGFSDDHKLSGWLTIRNACNLISSDWCIFREASFPRTQGVVEVDITDDNSQYIYTQFVEPSGQGRVTTPSLWEFRVGLTYRF